MPGLDITEVSPHYQTAQEAVWATLESLQGLAAGGFTLSCFIAFTLKVPKQQQWH